MFGATPSPPDTGTYFDHNDKNKLLSCVKKLQWHTSRWEQSLFHMSTRSIKLITEELAMVYTSTMGGKDSVHRSQGGRVLWVGF